METIQICILNTDPDYTNALVQKLSAKVYGFAIEVPQEDLFSSKTFDFKKYDMILADLFSGRRLMENGRDFDTPVLLLTESSEPMKLPERFMCIDRFVRISEIAARIRLFHAECNVTGCEEGVVFQRAGIGGNQTANRDGESANTEIISFIGLEGGAGTSSLALGLAGELSEYRDKKTLYFSLEPIESNILGITDIGNRIGRMSDIVYRFLKNKDSDRHIFHEYAKALLIEDSHGVKRIPPDLGKNSINELNPQELINFLDLMIENERPDYLILDLSSSLSKEMMHIALASDRIIALTAEKSMKYDSGSPDLAEIIFDDKPEGLITVLNKKRTSAETDKYDIEVGYDGSGFERRGIGIEIALTNEFGLGIKALADKILCWEEGLDTQCMNRFGNVSEGNGGKKTQHGTQEEKRTNENAEWHTRKTIA